MLKIKGSTQIPKINLNKEQATLAGYCVESCETVPLIKPDKLRRLVPSKVRNHAINYLEGQLAFKNLENNLQSKVFKYFKESFAQFHAKKIKNSIFRTSTVTDNELLEERIEDISELLDLTAQGNDILQLFGELTENYHELFHLSHHVSGLLIHEGWVGSFIASILGFITIPVVCILEKRSPKFTEVILMSLSMSALLLTTLTAIAAGNPFSAATCVLTATVLGLVRVVFGFYQEWHERKVLEQEINQLSKELNQLEEVLKEIINRLENNSSINLNKNEQQKTTFKKLVETLGPNIPSLNAQIVSFSKKNDKLLQYMKQRNNRWSFAQKLIYASASSLAIVAAILMLNPATYPLGMVLTLVASVASISTLTTSFAFKQIKNYFEKRMKKKPSSPPKFKVIEHSSNFHIIESLSAKRITVQQPIDEAAEEEEDMGTQEFPVCLSGKKTISNSLVTSKEREEADISSESNSSDVLPHVPYVEKYSNQL